jgi:aspartate dehydrogenase
VVAVCDNDPQRAAALCADHAPDAAVLTVEAVCASADIVLEAAGKAAVPNVLAFSRAAHAARGLPAHVVVLSIGGLLDCDPFAPGPVVHAPSGALGGLDAVQALAVAGLDSVSLTTRKPPKGLGLDVSEETIVFEGTARDAIERYPANVNVAVALSLAGIGPDRTVMRLIADPACDRNTHTVLARGAAGEIEFTSRNVPFPENPKTSWLAALSAIAMLQRISAQFQVG